MLCWLKEVSFILKAMLAVLPQLAARDQCSSSSYTPSPMAELLTPTGYWDALLAERGVLHSEGQVSISPTVSSQGQHSSSSSTSSIPPPSFTLLLTPWLKEVPFILKAMLAVVPQSSARDQHSSTSVTSTLLTPTG